MKCELLTEYNDRCDVEIRSAWRDTDGGFLRRGPVLLIVPREVVGGPPPKDRTEMRQAPFEAMNFAQRLCRYLVNNGEIERIEAETARQTQRAEEFTRSLNRE